jgi:hypothetical protein
MPADPDSIGVRVVQVDAPTDKPWDEPLDPSSEGFKVAAIFLIDPSNNDKLVALWRNGDDLKVRDVTNPGTSGEGYTLSQILAGGSGLTEGQHKALRQLIHFLPEGPGPGWGSGSNYKETIYDGIKPTAEIWWETSSKLKKIFSVDTAYTGIKPSTETFKVYDTDGSTVLAQAIDSITYSGLLETSRTRTITVY